MIHDIPHTFWMKLWFRIAAKGFLLIGGCLGSKWPIVPWVTLHFASCFVPAGKSSIVSDYLEDYLEELECASIESSFLRRIPGMKMTCVLRKADTPTFSVAGTDSPRSISIYETAELFQPSPPSASSSIRSPPFPKSFYVPESSNCYF